MKQANDHKLPSFLPPFDSPVAACVNIVIGGEALANALFRIAHSPVGAFCVLLGALDGVITT